ncbi:MAG TPA: flagellar assembly protein FliH [Burkholderiaceae bacterium]|nr:flagellar assembly protein FliH [Burkholderiaceae bacterium]
MSDETALDVAAARARWRRWKMSGFDTAANAIVDGQAPAHRAEELAARVQQARLAAYEQARVEGHGLGHAEGLRSGLDEGRAAGREEGYQAGYEAGHADGRAQGAEQAAAEATRLAGLAGACAQSLAALENEVGAALASLSLRIAEHIVRGALDIEPERIVDLVRQVLGNRDTDQDVSLTLHVHPSDLELVRHYMKNDHPGDKWRLCAVESMTPGGCLIHSSLGAVDATLETRWHNVSAALGVLPPPGQSPRGT